MKSTAMQCGNEQCCMFAGCKIKSHAEYCSVHNDYLANLTVRIEIGEFGREDIGGGKHGFPKHEKVALQQAEGPF